MKHKSPINVLYSFFREMKDWESAAYAEDVRLDSANANVDAIMRAADEQDKAVRAILKRYCVSRLRHRGRRATGNPTEYDPDRERVVHVSENNNVARITTERIDGHPLPGRSLYVMELENGEWRLAERKEIFGRRRERVAI